MPNRDRRVHQGGAGECRCPHPLAARNRVLSRLVSERGAPAFLRSDNGAGVCIKGDLVLDRRARISTALIEPGKPWQNGITESFNSKFRDECVSLE
jgi:putative transposase